MKVKKINCCSLYAFFAINLLAGLYVISQSLRMGCDEDADINDFSAPTWSSPIRAMWKQLQEETPFNQTRQRIITNLKHRALSASDDVVMVTHGSLLKLDTFLTQLEYWNGPTSFAVYMNGLGESTPDALDKLEFFLQENKNLLKQVSIHLFMEYTKTTKKPPAYPHNPLRNLAMDESNSDYIVALDVDFIPLPKNCYSKLHRALRAQHSSLAKEIRTKRRIMVLPAFEVYASNGTKVATKDQLPASKEELYESIKANRSETFRVKRYSAGHGPTNFKLRFDSFVNPHSLFQKPAGTKRYFGISYRPGFEPYVLAYRHGLPKYWNTFRGFGQNKLSWFLELHRAGYNFGTLLDFFVVHLEHPSTANWLERHENLVKYEAFLDYLNEKYPLASNKRRAVDRRFYYDPKEPAPGARANTTDGKPPKKKPANLWHMLSNQTKSSYNKSSVKKQKTSSIRKANVTGLLKTVLHKTSNSSQAVGNQSAEQSDKEAASTTP